LQGQPKSKSMKALSLRRTSTGVPKQGTQTLDV
jgi:hypothetical protein